MGDDKEEEEIEGTKGEEIEEAPTQANPKKRKAKAQPMVKANKNIKPSPAKPSAPTTRASTQATTQKAKEKTKKIEQDDQVQKKKRRKYVAQPDSDEERIESDDISQFKVVSHKPLFDLENLCENIRNSADLSSLNHIDFEKLEKEEKNLVEDAFYAMVSKFKNTPLEFSNTIRKSLYDIVEKKWHYY